MKELTAAVVPGLLALVGVKASELLGITSTAGKIVAAAVGAVGGVYLASKV